MPFDGKALYRLRYLLVLGMLAGGASLAQTPPAARDDPPPFAAGASPADISILTYNVKGLPWPIARGRDEALDAIAARLARLRRGNRQPSVVVLQEAFTDEAKTIGDRAGYAFQVHGPYARTSPGELPEAGGDWQLGETSPSVVDSGLAILSDFPVLAVERAEFPSGACAGYDCLAAKGVVMATIDVPGKGPVAVAATHLNSRKASGAPFERTHAAYRRQTEFLSDFLAAHASPGTPLVLTGDFNRGQRPVRKQALDTALAAIPGKAPPIEALRALARLQPRIAGDSEIGWIIDRARDMQFVFGATGNSLAPVAADVTFGRESDGSMLSDHMGFTIGYRFE